VGDSPVGIQPRKSPPSEGKKKGSSRSRESQNPIHLPHWCKVGQNGTRETDLMENPPIKARGSHQWKKEVRSSEEDPAESCQEKREGGSDFTGMQVAREVNIDRCTEG